MRPQIQCPDHGLQNTRHEQVGYHHIDICQKCWLELREDFSRTVKRATEKALDNKSKKS